MLYSEGIKFRKCHSRISNCPSRISNCPSRDSNPEYYTQFKWGFQFVLVETPIGVSTRLKPVEIPIGICPSRNSNWSFY